MKILLLICVKKLFLFSALELILSFVKLEQSTFQAKYVSRNIQ